jgi:hypothetical protein
MYPVKSDVIVSFRSGGNSKVQYSLLLCIELVEEAFIGYNRALGDEGSAICIIGFPLENTMPMLQRITLSAWIPRT